MKVVWICHFSNQQIREILPLSERRIYNKLRKLLGKEILGYQDFAPWVTNQIFEFEKYDNVELHVIAPHSGLIPFKFSFTMNGVHYHFFKPELPLLIDIIAAKALRVKKRKYLMNRKLVSGFIKKIKPDIVNLVGAENPYYSITILDIKDVPIYVSNQAVYANPLWKVFKIPLDQNRCEIEKTIHEKEIYFGCSSRMHRDLILKNNPNAIVFKLFFPVQKPLIVPEIIKEYDFVFFAASVTKIKGIEDAIEALALVKKDKNDITLNVVGDCAPKYQERLDRRIAELGLTLNVSFNNYFPIQSSMHRHIQKARYALLPIILDAISGTVVEAMLLELPVVTYKTTGTPYLNKDGETVLLAEIGDIEQLAKNMLKLINDNEFADTLKRKARAFAEKEFDNTTSAKRLLSNYQAVIAHYHNNAPIPQEILFDVNEFPIYK